MYFFGKLSKDKLATFLFAVSPYFLHLCGETRGYGFLCLFAILALIGHKWAFPLALFTQHYAWFLLLAIPFSLWYLPFLGASGWLVYLQSGAEQVFASGRGFEPSLMSVAKKIAGLFIQFGGGVQYSFLTPQQALSLAPLAKLHLFLFLSPAVFLFFSKTRKYLRLFLVPLLVLMIIYPIRLNARYLPFCGVAYIILLVEGFRELEKRHRYIARTLMSGFIAANIFSAIWLFSVDFDPYHREDYIGAAHYIDENIRDTDGLIGCTYQVSYYLKKDFPGDGKDIWEVYLGNPDMTVNEAHWRYQENELGRKAVFKKQFGDLVWVIRYSE
ncbi:MAG: hypothetical protein PHW14_05645, partial [Candidatus Omnitrophica bacterium]|nr:hypothetical protein [Candidatus Omnitrophota bacterium]